MKRVKVICDGEKVYFKGAVGELFIEDYHGATLDEYLTLLATKYTDYAEYISLNKVELIHIYEMHHDHMLLEGLNIRLEKLESDQNILGGYDCFEADQIAQRTIDDLKSRILAINARIESRKRN